MLGIQVEMLLMVSGVNEEPSITPRIGITNERIRFEPRTGAFANAAAVANTIGPIIQGRGIVMNSKIKPPIAPRPKLPSINMVQRNHPSLGSFRGSVGSKALPLVVFRFAGSFTVGTVL